MSMTDDFDLSLDDLDFQPLAPAGRTRLDAADLVDLGDAVPVSPDDLLGPDDLVVTAPPVPRKLDVEEDDGGDPMAKMGLKAERSVPLMEKPWMKHHVFHLVKTIEEVEALVDECLQAGHCALDTETEGLDTRLYPDENGKLQTVHRIVGYCVSPGDGHEGYYIPVRHKPEDGGPDLNVKPLARVEAAITRLCLAAQPTPTAGETDLLGFAKHEAPPKVVIDFWNAAFDQEMLYPVTGIDYWHPDGFEDGQLARFVIFSDDKQLGLKFKAPDLLRDKEGNPYEMIEFKELFARGRAPRFDTLSPDEPSVVNYACSDAICTRLLALHPEVVPMAKSPKFAWAYRIEKQTAQVKRVMERNRVKVNRAKVKEILGTAAEERDAWRQKIIALAESKGFANFEPGSPAQLGPFLFDPQGLNIEPKPPKNEKSQQYKTDAATFEEMIKGMGDNAPPVLQWVMNYREQDKLIGTYLQSMADNGDKEDEFRFQFKQTGAATGRFSAPSGDADQGFGGIPIHGIPGTSALRTCFEARPGYLMVKCDFAGEELRIVTNLSNEPVWVQEFLEGEGDLHTITARAFFAGYDNEPKEKQKVYRKAGKVANFALVYGGGPAAVQRAVGCDKVEARRKKDAFDKALPVFAQWVKKQHEKVKVDRGVYTAFGRWIAIPDAAIKEGDYQHFDRVNKKHGVVDRDRAQMIRAECERHATNYPIQGSGADIMKIAMILVHKQCHRRGWLKDGDDSVRMLLTVHDELVFEIKPHRLIEALDVITDNMELPWKMARPPFSPKWKVPLVTDPLIGTTWAAETTARRAKSDDELPNEKESEVRAGPFFVKKPPAWLVEVLAHQSATTPANPISIPAPGAPTPAPSPTPAASAPLPTSASAPPPAKPVSAPPPSVPAGKVLSAQLNSTVRRAVYKIAGLCAECYDKNGAVLRLLSPTGQVLIDPKEDIRVHPERFLARLNEGNWSNGSYALD